MYIVKRLWKEIEESGLGKYDYLHKEGLHNKYLLNCPLCEYTKHKFCGVFVTDCDKCPLPKEKKMEYRCYELGFEDELPPAQAWLNVIKGLKE